MTELEAVKLLGGYVYRMSEERGDTAPHFSYDTDKGLWVLCDWDFYPMEYNFSDAHWESSNADPVALWNELQAAIVERDADMAEERKEQNDD